MTWNYRVFYERVVNEDLGIDEDVYSIREAYYDDDKDIPHSCVADYTSGYLYSDTLEGLKADWGRMGEALKKPVLTFEGDRIIELTTMDLEK